MIGDLVGGRVFMDWSLVSGLALGLGIPALSGLNIIVRMENRVTQLEKEREADHRWRETVGGKLDAIARDVNQLIGGNGKAHHE
jgi:hypothetical protein